MVARDTDCDGDSITAGRALPGRGVTARGPVREAMRQLRRSPGAMAGAILFGLLVVTAVLAPWIAPHDPIRMSPNDILTAPNSTYLLGTDQYGRDVLSRILLGTPISLTLGLISVGIAAAVGTCVGLSVGYWGGMTDKVAMRVIDVMMAFPGILLALAVVAVLGPGLYNVMIAVGISGIPTYARMVRGSVLSAKENLYVDAARALGAVDVTIMWRHVLPNVVAPIIVLATLGLGTAILSGASLSYLGLGAQPPTPEWGSMLSTGRDYLRSQWWISTFPGLAIMVTVMAVNLLGDGLRDALDPRLRV
jgi:peptide/nickel transport system permease protein